MRLKTIGKRGAGLLLSALLALSLCLPVSAAGGAGYTDLRGHWAESQLQWAVEQGYLTGTSATTLSPNKTLTRGMAAVILYRYAGSPTAGENSRFSDVPAGAYYAKAVAWAVENGITKGTSETTFHPDETCTRAQGVTFLYRALGKLAAAQAGFTDVAADSYYADAVNWAAENGVTNGISETLFGPDGSCTRAQIVTFLYRAYQGK